MRRSVGDTLTVGAKTVVHADLYSYVRERATILRCNMLRPFSADLARGHVSRYTTYLDLVQLACDFTLPIESRMKVVAVQKGRACMHMQSF
jgi:hypothetical protein